MSPTISTKAPAQKRQLKSKASMAREKKIFIGIVIGCAVSVLIHLVLQIVANSTLSSARELEVAAYKEQRLASLMEAKLQFSTQLEIASKAQKEDLARKQRREEWRLREAMDPAYAVSQMEKNMLEMKRIGADHEIDDKDALVRIAKLAGPPRTGAGVSTVRRKGWKVEVVFAYEEVIDGHPEVAKYTPGVYREVKRTAAGIVRDVFAYGGDRGVYQVTVSCQQLVTVSTREGKRKDRRDMLIVTGKSNHNWKNMDRAEAEDAVRFERDYFDSLIK